MPDKKASPEAQTPDTINALLATLPQEVLKQFPKTLARLKKKAPNSKKRLIEKIVLFATTN